MPTYPRRYGYAWVGVVEGAGGSRLGQGTRVFALAPHGSAHVLSAGDVWPVRTDIPAARAALAANLETAVTATWDAAVALGERAIVLGAGTVGLLTGWLLSRAGAAVTFVEPSALRRACVAALVPGARALGRSEPDGSADLVVEATGSPGSLDAAIAWCAPDARVLVVSFYGRRRAPIDLGDAFHRRRLSLVASQVSSIPPRLRGRFDAARRFALVDELLGEPRLDALLGPATPFERAPELYERLAAAADSLPCHVFEYA
jgi:threonine dehydrogenase-like Zn-dependent dehydrogenase